MKSIVVGGGKIGFYLLKTLKDRGFEAVLVERDAEVSRRIAEELDVNVFCGDGTDAEVLKDAGIGDAEVIAAVTGTDEANLVICKIAKTYYQIDKTIARVNNPKNRSMFKALGVDKTVCSTEVIANLIEYEFEKDDYRVVQVLDRGSIILTEINIGEGNSWCGHCIRDLTLPAECVIASILRSEKAIYPRGNTQILAGDNILLAANKTALAELRRRLRNGGGENARQKK